MNFTKENHQVLAFRHGDVHIDELQGFLLSWLERTISRAFMRARRPCSSLVHIVEHVEAYSECCEDGWFIGVKLTYKILILFII